MIRQFRPGDAQACFDLIRACIMQDIHTPTGTLEKLLHAESAESISGRARLYYLVVYELEDDIAGVAGLDMNEIRLLFVAPDRQGKESAARCWIISRLWFHPLCSRRCSSIRHSPAKLSTVIAAISAAGSKSSM